MSEPVQRSNITRISSALKSRDVQLNPSANKDDLLALSSGLTCSLNETLREIYLQFNGFQNLDYKSQVWFWPIERVLEMSSLLSTDKDNNRYFAFGDLMLESDYIMISPGVSTSPVILLYEQKEIAPSLEEFFVSLIAGNFDFL